MGVLLVLPLRPRRGPFEVRAVLPAQQHRRLQHRPQRIALCSPPPTCLATTNLS